MEGDKSDKAVSWKIFTWIIGIVTLLLGILFQTQTVLSDKVDDISDNSLEIEVRLSQIQTDIQWIKLNIQKQ